MFDVDGQYAARSRAKVIDNVDPLGRGRIRVNHPLLGETVWISYLKLPNFYNVPSIDDIVYVEADCGDYNFPVAWGNIVVGPDDSVLLPDVFKRKNPTNSGFYSPGGHLVEIDDGLGIARTNKGIRLTTSGGIKLDLKDDDGSINIETGLGDIKVVGPVGSLTVTKDGDVSLIGPTVSYSASKDGDIAITGPVGSATIGKDGAISIKNSVGSLVITPAGQLELKGAADGLVDLLVQAFQALSTQTAAGLGAPTSTVATFAQLAVKAQALKA